MIPKLAMVFAAGLGKRMMPLTADRPKPMVEIKGKPLLGYALDKVAAAGIEQAIVNVHYKPEAVIQYLGTRAKPLTEVSRETELLETGGGIKKVLPLLGDAPFLAVNSDILVQDASVNAITRLGEAWDGDKMDVLLLLTPKDKAYGHESQNGDYVVAADGKLKRLSNPDAPYLYAGFQITKPELYRAADLGDKFSNLEIFDRAERAGRLYGLVHDGAWHHFSTPQSVHDFNARP